MNSDPAPANLHLSGPPRPDGPPPTPRLWRVPGALATALVLALALAACGSSSTSAPTSAQVKHETCRQIEGALADGPDPEADPVGHAQAQVLPLHQIHTSDAELHRAIDALASAYQAFSSSNGAGSTKSAVDGATKTVESLCPGIES
ncbi:MAG TPA: hypothetical protein VGL54_09380 [Solirubrobacteraceae bacterium]|jgi:hypothetical protein